MLNNNDDEYFNFASPENKMKPIIFEEPKFNMNKTFLKKIDSNSFS